MIYVIVVINIISYWSGSFSVLCHLSIVAQQIGKWTDDKKAADFIAGVVAKKGSGVHDEILPDGISGKSFLPDGTEIIPNMATIVVKPNGSVRTAFPFNNSYTHNQK